jgi:hypothetical protein
MRDLLRQLLDNVPPLKRSNELLRCKMCGGDARLFDVVDFNKMCSVHEPLAFGASNIGVPYYVCEECDCIFTFFCDDWDAEAFRRYIYNEDYIKVDGEYVSARPTRNAQEMSGLLLGMEGKRILDYGSGSGVFSGLMNKFGYSTVESYDPFSQPNRPAGKFDIVTAFEVIEHSPSPISTLNEMKDFLTDDGVIIFSQAMQPTNISQIKGSWWYLGPRNGHVTTFSHKTMVKYAERSHLTFFTSPHVYGFSNGSSATSLLSRISQRCYIKRFTSADQPGFHDVEAPPDRKNAFRWSASDHIVWPQQTFEQGYTLIEIPFALEVEPSFASKCQIFGEGIALPTYIRNSSLIAETDFVGVATVSLSTPACRSPREIRGTPDDRRLGLAILAA